MKTIKNLILYSILAVAASIFLAYINNTDGVSTDLGAVLFVGLGSGIAFFILCFLMYRKVKLFAVGPAILSCFLAVLVFIGINAVINLFIDLGFLFQPKYEIVIWIYTLLLYYVSNVLLMFLLSPINQRIIKKQERIKELTGRN